MKPAYFARLGFLTGVLLLAAAAWAEAASLEPITGDHDQDLRVFVSDKDSKAGVRVLEGAPALRKMLSGTELNLWLAGNQFFAMKDVVKAFIKAQPAVKSVGVITLPPGEVADAIVKGGWSYQGHSYLFRPDLFGTVDLKHIRELSKAGLASRYFTYVHNELSLMVAQGNPKRISGIDDLKRGDLKIDLPNPLTEGIMSTYGKKVLERHGLWRRLSGGEDCKACSPVKNVYFTDVHHREIPAALEAGKADVGLVWKTEIENSVQEGKSVEGVGLPPEDSLRDEVSYVITPVVGGGHSGNASRYLRFLRSKPAQAAYASHGFVPARRDELDQFREIGKEKQGEPTPGPLSTKGS